MHLTRSFVITVCNNRVSWRLHLEHVAVIVTRAHCCLTAADHCYVMVGTIKFVDKSVNDHSLRRLDHCDVIALCSENRRATRMETKFDVIILTEIGARNLSVVLNIFPNYSFHYVRPHDNNYGGVGIYTHDSLLNVVLRDDVMLTKSYNCSKCEFESLFIEFMYNGLSFTVGGIYRHPSGNVTHFVSSLETILTKLDDRKNVILAGDMNIDLVKHTNENVISYMSTMMSYRYLPYVTLPTRITQFSTTCIDHIFVKKSYKEKVISTLCGMFYCDISDHLPCFISLQYASSSCTGNRPMSRIFGARNCSKFVQKMTTENWNDKYADSEDDWYHTFVTTVYQIFQQSFPLVQLSRQRV